MYKYSFLIYHEDYLSFLNELRDVGVVHVIERKQEVSEDINESLQLISRIKEVVKFLDRRVEEKHPVKQTKKDGLELINEIQDKRHELDKLEQKKAVIKKKINDIEPWGDFSLDTIEKLKKNNIALHFYICPENLLRKNGTRNILLKQLIN